jgi:ATP-dependent 26S proteasome regulatory subunit
MRRWANGSRPVSCVLPPGVRPRDLLLTSLPVRLSIKQLSADYDKTEDDMKALQSVGQIIGEVLKQLDDERCKSPPGASGRLTDRVSHRQGVVRTSLRSLVPADPPRRQGELLVTLRLSLNVVSSSKAHAFHSI